MKDNFNSFQTYIGCFNLRILKLAITRFEVDRCQIQPIFTDSTVCIAADALWMFQYHGAERVTWPQNGGGQFIDSGIVYNATRMVYILVFNHN